MHLEQLTEGDTVGFSHEIEAAINLVSNEEPSLSVELDISDKLKDISERLSKKLKPEEEIEEIEDKEDVIEEIDDLRFLYGLMEEQNTEQIDYGKLFSYLEHKADLSSIYEDQQEEESKDFWVMSDTEAEETVQKIQVSYLTGNREEASFKEREMFHNWQTFNKSLLFLYQSLSVVQSANVDYDRIRN